MPTVTSMLKTLSKGKLIDYEKYEYLELTDKGGGGRKGGKSKASCLAEISHGYPEH